MSPRAWLLGPLMSLLGFGLGCAQSTPQQAATPTPRASAPGRVANDSPARKPDDALVRARHKPQDPFLDGTLATAVRRELDHGADLGIDRVEVQVRDGVATLQGQVPTWDDALRAVQRVETTRGLRAVINHLSVEGSEKDGDRLAWQVAMALDQAGISHQMVRVNGGKVELTGKAASLSQKQRAENVARSIPGVRGVENRLVVEPTAVLTDGELGAAIEKRLETSGYIDGLRIELAVSQGVVTLSGTMETLYAKQRVLELASIDGARELDARALVVSPRRPLIAPPPPFSPEQTRAVAAGPEAQGRSAASDESLQRQVASRLNQHPSIATRKVHVAVDRRVATLSGSVDSDFQSSCAERAAGLVRGVRSVDNQLRLEPSTAHFRGDADVARALEEELWWDVRLDPGTLQVSVENGTATISGRVEDWEQRAAVVENVSQVAPLRFVNRVEAPDLPELAHATDPR